jgi:hypothetical protein
MVLSDKYAGKPEASIVKKTLLYVLGFGFGALALVGLLSLIMVSIAEGILPSAEEKPATSRKAGAGPEIIGESKPTRPTRPGSKAAGQRANEADESDESSAQEL